jgi:hypothetical protein
MERQGRKQAIIELEFYANVIIKLLQGSIAAVVVYGAVVY